MDSTLLDSLRRGDRKALTRALTAVEEGGAIDTPSPPTGVIGITGPPGAGKSTLISELIGVIRANGESVAVLAVDPSSPITGGAILGDRIRMQAHIDDPDVYIRSMATRGHLGGLAPTTAAAATLLCEAAFDWVIVETVGVGQSEVEIMQLAQVVVLVVGPSWGDQIQADKAGIVEIADVFVINKADRPGAREVRRALLEVADRKGAPVLLTTATTGDGVESLYDEIVRLLG